MGKTSIEWTQFSVNPIRARIRGTTDKSGHYCEKIGPDCRECYASRMQPRFGMPQFQEQRKMRDDIETFLDVDKLLQVLDRKVSTTWFWCDMTDMFGRWVPNEMIAACFAVMAATPQHTHQVLTKRADRLPEWFEWFPYHYNGPRKSPEWATPMLQERLAAAPKTVWPLPNLHLGVSAGDQNTFDERLHHLMRVPAAVRWWSGEPLIGPVDGSRLIRPIQYVDGYRHASAGIADVVPSHLGAPGLDWVVLGGESGPRARSCDTGWIESIVDECLSAGVPVFVKQLGAKPTETIQTLEDPEIVPLKLLSRKGGDPNEWPPELRWRRLP